MLPSCKMIGFVLTTDYDKAKAFFVEKLGFKFVSLDQWALVLRCGENMVRVVKVPDFTAQRGTVLGWEVPNIDEAVAWLKQRGVTLERYPFMGGSEIWDPPGADRIAWFKDPDGNVLSVSQHARDSAPA